MTAPLVSVVVPTRDRPSSLGTCLAALAGQAVPPERLEVVVVDDGGRGSLDAALARAAPLEPVLVRIPHAGPAAARNAGAAAARGRVLAFTDDDCVPSPRWLEALVTALAREPRAVVGGRTVNTLAASLCAEASQELVGFLYADGLRRHGELPFVATNNLALDRGAFERCGGFDVSFRLAGGEDRDLCDRLRAAGVRLLFEPAALVRHAHVMGLPGFVRQHVAYGRGAYRYHRARALRGEEPVRVEGPAFYAQMLARPFRRLPRRRAVPTAALVALSQAGTAAGFALEAAATCAARRP